MMPRIPVPRGEPSSEPFGTLQREINRVFDHMFGGVSAPASGFAPSVEMKATEEGVMVTAELPGIEEKGGFHLSERSYGSFRRSIRLPWPASPADARAAFDKGVLTIALKRPPEAAPRVNRIPIGGAPPRG